MSVDLTEYKQIENSNYYINKEGLVFNTKSQKYLVVKSNGSVNLSINKKSKTFGIKKILSELFSNIDFNEYKQIHTSFHYVNKKGEIVNKYNENVKPRNVNGYFMVSICKNKQKKDLYIHRIVAELYLPNPDNLPEVHHKDNDKSNNNIDNLQWTTKSMNCRMSSKTKNSGLPR